MSIYQEIKIKSVVSTNPYLCFAACLEMVINHLSKEKVNQEEIGEFLGITYPPEIDISIYKSSKNFLFNDKPESWGVDVDTNRINDFLKTYKIPFQCKFKSVLVFDEWDFEEFIISLIKNFKPIILGFDYNYVYSKEDKRIVGHAVVGHGYVQKNKDSFLNIFDPGPYNFGEKNISFENLYISAKRKRGGLWYFEQK